MASQVAFFVFSLIVVVAAWRVVTTDDVVRAALALVVALGGLAPLFILLAAEFIATVQVLVYVGAVLVLLLFGIMLTRSPMEKSDRLDYPRRVPGFLVSIGLFAVLWYAIREAYGDEELELAVVGRTADVGSVLLRNQVIAFELASVLLLAALVGAIVVARRD